MRTLSASRRQALGLTVAVTVATGVAFAAYTLGSVGGRELVAPPPHRPGHDLLHGDRPGRSGHRRRPSPPRHRP